jgi:FemAB-related protein (PEP-CTERM system-associated)
MSNPTIIECSSSEDWNTFVSTQQQSTCFHLYGWRLAIEKELGYVTHYLAFLDDGIIRGVFPVAIVKSRLFGSAMVGLPFCSYGGPVSQDSTVRLALFKRALEIARQERVGYLEFRSVDQDQDLAQHCINTTYFTFRKAMPEGEANLTFLPSKRRNMVRKGQNLGHSWSVRPDIDSFFNLYAENAHAHGTPALPKRFFRTLMQALGGAVDILFVTDKNGVDISCIMSFYHQGVVHAGFAGELSSARQLAANDFKYWSLYQHAKTRGCTTFDLGRSKVDTGSFEFKKLWGFTATPLHHEFELITKTEPPSNNPNNPKFAAAIKIWAKLPRPIVDRLGPLVIHGLG